MKKKYPAKKFWDITVIKIIKNIGKIKKCKRSQNIPYMICKRYIGSKGIAAMSILLKHGA